MSAGKTYPILQNTSVRTDNGTASFSFGDGSRIDLSKHSSATVDGMPSAYSLYLPKGVIAFNVAGPASLYISTPYGSASVNRGNSVVQKVSQEKAGRTLGVVSVTGKGTEFRSISGKLVVNVSASETRQVSAGEVLSIDPQNRFRVSKVQALTRVGRGLSYKIREADILEIRAPGFEGYHRVDGKGEITFRNNSVFKVSGLTPAEVEALLAAAFRSEPPSTVANVMDECIGGAARGEEGGRARQLARIGRLGSDDADYKIGNADLLEIRTPALEGYYRVDRKGEIKLPDNRVFKVSGLTPAEAEALLVAAYRTDPLLTFVYVVDEKCVAVIGDGGGAAAATAAAAGYPPGEIAAAWGIGALYAETVSIISFEVWRDPETGPLQPASPSGFQVR